MDSLSQKKSISVKNSSLHKSNRFGSQDRVSLTTRNLDLKHMEHHIDSQATIGVSYINEHQNSFSDRKFKLNQESNGQFSHGYLL